MELDISGLKYYSLQNYNFSEENALSEVGKNFETDESKKSAEELVMRHNKKTKSKLEQYKNLLKRGKISDSDFRMYKLEAAAKDLIYQLTVCSSYNNSYVY